MDNEGLLVHDIVPQFDMSDISLQRIEDAIREILANPSSSNGIYAQLSSPSVSIGETTLSQIQEFYDNFSVPVFITGKDVKIRRQRRGMFDIQYRKRIVRIQKKKNKMENEKFIKDLSKR